MDLDENFENEFDESSDEMSDENVIEIADIFEEAMENYKIAKESWRTIYDASISDRKFGLFGEQWDVGTLT